MTGMALFLATLVAAMKAAAVWLLAGYAGLDVQFWEAGVFAVIWEVANGLSEAGAATLRRSERETAQVEQAFARGEALRPPDDDRG